MAEKVRFYAEPGLHLSFAVAGPNGNESREATFSSSGVLEFAVDDPCVAVIEDAFVASPAHPVTTQPPPKEE